MRLLLGISGGIAAYKAADIASKCVGMGWQVRVVMTPAATRFVGPLTFEGLVGHPVMIDALATGASPDGTGAIEHIAWAKWADVALIAPLTANTLAKLAMGLADDALTTVCLALPQHTPLLLAPAMNTAMWESPVTQRNVRWLSELNRYTWIAPVEKRLACGDYGNGGMAEVPVILDTLMQLDAHTTT